MKLEQRRLASKMSLHKQSLLFSCAMMRRQTSPKTQDTALSWQHSGSLAVSGATRLSVVACRPDALDLWGQQPKRCCSRSLCVDRVPPASFREA